MHMPVHVCTMCRVHGRLRARQVDMSYMNMKDGDVLSPLEGVRKNVDVEFTIKPQTAVQGWRSVGPQTFYPVYPSGENQTFHRVTRYPQDVSLPIHTLSTP